MDDFSKQKIVYRQISNCMDASIVEADVFINDKCYMITGEHLIYLISVLNSTLFNKVIFQSANTTGGKGFAFLGKVCVPFPTSDIESQLIDLYHERVHNDSSVEIDRKVDQIIFSIYNISPSEVTIIK